MIIIDEEHDSSYKQEERFCYHARDLALWLADQEKIPIVLGSATPSLESLYRVERGKMRLLSLTQRPAGSFLPALEILDRREISFSRDKKESHPLLSENLIEALRRNLEKKEQSLLFLNRRGFSPFVLCPQCGFVPQCKQCDISLTMHKGGGGRTPPLQRLICHYCDEEIAFHPVCSQCQKGSLNPLGYGTERIDQDLKKIFPSARIERMDRDTAKAGGWLRTLEKMKRGEIDIQIGTQMVVKGHDYPNLTLVGILDADSSLYLPDFRATERTYQLITQVSGRAGRSTKPGRVIVQTYHPQNEGLRAAVSYDGKLFCTRELRQRKEAHYPPFVRLVEVRLAGADRQTVIKKMQILENKIHKSINEQEATLLGPAPCTVELVRGKNRWRLLLKTTQYSKIQPRLRRLLDDFLENDLTSSMRLLINVDPLDMM